MAEARDLENKCKYATKTEPHWCRDEILECSCKEYLDDINLGKFDVPECVGVRTFSTGHARMDAYINEDEFLECPYREEKPSKKDELNEKLFQAEALLGEAVDSYFTARDEYLTMERELAQFLINNGEDLTDDEVERVEKEKDIQKFEEIMEARGKHIDPYSVRLGSAELTIEEFGKGLKKGMKDAQDFTGSLGRNKLPPNFYRR